MTSENTGFKDSEKVLGSRTKCHDCRNLAEYEGHVEINDQLLLDLLKATRIVLDAVHEAQK